MKTTAASTLLILIACSGSPPPSESVAPSPSAPSFRSAQTAAPLLRAELDFAAERWVEQTLASLSLAEEAAQLVMPWISGAYTSTSSDEFQELAGWVEDLGLGGVLPSIGLPHSYAAKLNELQRRARVPLLVGSDFENGGPGMRINHMYAVPTLLPQGGGTSFPPTMAFGAVGDEAFAYEYGRITAAEARAVGVHMIFAPVLDVNSNPDNPIINTRSFGESPTEVGRLGRAFIEGAREGGVLTTAKHFPGHGDTEIDSHVALPIVTADRDRLDRFELVPFQWAIDAGVDAVMTAHVSVPEILGEDAPPATMSPYFMSTLLREDMGFEGLLVTDALRMAAITDAYGEGDAAVVALEAGSDVILAPHDPATAVEALVSAVASGRVSRDRLQASVRRVLEVKARVGLHEDRFVDLDAVDEIVGSGAHVGEARQSAERALTLVADPRNNVPLDLGRTRTLLSVTYARASDVVAGLAFDAELRRYGMDVRSVRVEAETRLSTYDELRATVDSVDALLVSVYTPPAAAASNAGVAEPLTDLVRAVEGRATVVVTSLGNPYLQSAFPTADAYLIGWGPRELPQEAAARALLGAVPITGRLPITLPPSQRPGMGLDRAGTGVQPVTDSRDPLADAGVLPGRERDRTRVALRGFQESDMRISPLEVDPAEVGMSGAGLAALDSLVREGIADGVAPGVAVAVGRHGKLVRLRGYGRLDHAPSAAPADPATIWDLASLTKVVGTTTAAMLLVEEGRVDLDAPVIRYLPSWADGDGRKRDVTVRQLLLHRGGLPPFRRWYQDNRGKETYARLIDGLELAYAPGDSTVYSDIGLMTIARVVEAVSGLTLDAFLASRVFGPLGMVDTGFNPDSSLLERIAPTEIDTIYRSGHVWGEVHDENASAQGGVAGHAGLFSSARDLSVFAAMMMNNGEVPACFPAPRLGVPCSGPRTAGSTLLNASTIRLFTRRHDGSASRALGWDTPSGNSSAGQYFSRQSFGHTGFTGTSIWMDPGSGLFVVLLTNRVNPTRTNTRHVQFRRTLHDLAALAITDEPVRRR